MKKKEQVKIESNLIENLPIHFSRKPNKWKEKEIVKLKNGELIVRQHRDLGYFYPFDVDVLMATWAICGQCGYEQKFPATAQQVRKKLQLKTSGKNLKMVAMSLLRLSQTGLEYKGSFYDFNTQKYTGHASFHVLEFYFFDKEERKLRHVTMKEIFKLSYIKFSDIIFDSFLKGYFKYIDFNTYLSLPSGLTRMTYLYIEKRLGKKETYAENIEGVLKSVTHNETIPSQEVRDFKRRTIPHLKEIYHVKVNGRILTITKKARTRFIPQEPLSDHEEYVLDHACQECGRTDDFFKNTIRKYMRILGSQMVDGLIGETKYNKPRDMSRYLIDLLKKDAASKQEGQGARV